MSGSGVHCRSQCQKKANMVQMTVPWAAHAKVNGEPASFSFILSDSLKESKWRGSTYPFGMPMCMSRVTILRL